MDTATIYNAFFNNLDPTDPNYIYTRQFEDKAYKADYSLACMDNQYQDKIGGLIRKYQNDTGCWLCVLCLDKTIWYQKNKYISFAEMETEIRKLIIDKFEFSTDLPLAKLKISYHNITQSIYIIWCNLFTEQDNYYCNKESAKKEIMALYDLLEN